MKTVFHDVVKAIDSNPSDEEINNYFDNLIANELNNQELGKTKIEFSPDYELSYGHSRGHITISAVNNKK